MAKEHGIDLSSVEGTGAGGRISKQDIEAVIAAGGVPAAALQRIPLRSRRRLRVRRLLLRPLPVFLADKRT